MTKEIFIEIANKTHNNQYDYSLLPNEFKCEDNINIICKNHGIFKPRASRFLKGSNCPLCSKKGLKTTEMFISEYKEKFNIYDLSKFQYINSHTKSIANCKKHGDFEISPTNLLNGCGCPKCKTEKQKGLFLSSFEEFVIKSKKIHGDKYEYIGKYVNNSTRIEIKCKECEKTFLQLPHNHLQGKGCPYCHKSHLESQLMLIFDENKIEYEYQKHFEWLGKQSLDFYLPNYNIAIECQGIQHFEQTKFGDLDINIENDIKKHNLCSVYGITLLYLTNKYLNIKPYFYTKDNTIDSINDVYSVLHINPLKTSIECLLRENNIEYEFINNKYFKINNFYIYPILNCHVFNKENECNEISITNEINGIRTMWIKQYEWEDKNKRNVLSSFILSECGIIKHKIYARNCIIKEISNEDTKDFLIKNSMYGFRRASLSLGLFNKENDELLMVYTFGNAFYGKGKYDIEVIRVATKTEYQVIGGTSKLWNYFLKHYETIKINNKEIKWNTCVYYVDFDHNNGKSLCYLKFNFEYYTKGGFHNFNRYTNKVSNRIPSKNKTIKELIDNNIVVKIQTSGTKVYVYDKRKFY